ncbi:hypothetical protein EAO71_27305 [Streptomyces sp. ms191]|uniref:hypothetical protein n=1 Tax=Streptomyces sp. ms191 TaxID=1827978 RepID=UPI0011CE3E95|nr:hypothetical protein [Streptomyces sp. ms191]TXS21410.1 hypothetical protein EAO71_27305 [Streptomyces sp. ms191]
MTTDTQRTANRVARQRKASRQRQGIDGHIAGSIVADHIRKCLDAGWTRLGLAEASTVSERAIRYILGGQPQVQRDNGLRLLNVKPEHSPKVPPLGSIRRIKALARAGYTIDWTATQVACSNRHIYEILNGTVDAVDRTLAERFAALYRRHEATPGPSRPARIAAASKNWPGPDGWDSDSIDDPEAHPDWTGFCGTDRGWWTHRLERIAACERCQNAHDEWLQAHQGLSHGDRFKALGRAKAEASNRGAAIVEDARELMRLGASYEVAAQRLGITRQYLQQELGRHPEQQTAA